MHYTQAYIFIFIYLFVLKKRKEGGSGVLFSKTNSESMEAGSVETVVICWSTVPVHMYLTFRQEVKILIALSNQNS
jgi:hypothetical protein